MADLVPPLRPLGEVTENLDAARRPVKASERKPGPYPYYGAQGVVDYVDRYLFDGEFVLVAEDGENLRSRKEPIAMMAWGKFWVNNHAHIIRGGKEADTRYLHYAINAADISGYVTGSTIPKLSQGNLNRLLIPCPQVAEQRAIASILSALDDKIELNRQMNETLEATARTIFKDWFVDFGPTRAKAEGRAHYLASDIWFLFPDRFDEEGKPHGWSRVELGSVTSDLRRGISPAYVELGGVRVLNQKCIRNRQVDPTFSRRHDPTKRAVDGRTLEVGDILVNSTGVGTLGPLRANIAETLSPALITEQGENGNQREYESEAQWIRRGGCGLARRGTERG